MNVLHRWYRVLATGTGFLVFGIGTLAVSLLLVCTPRRRITVASIRKQRLASKAMRVFLRFLQGIGVIREIAYDGRKHLPEEGPYIVISNHPTLLDPVFLMAILDPVDCIVKDKHAPFFGILARWLEYIPDQYSMGLFEACKNRIERGRNLLLFPERTRSPEGDLHSFSRIPAQISIDAQCRVIPALIQVNHHAFGRDQSWYDVPPEPLRVKLTFHEPDRPEKTGTFSEQSRELTDRWEQFYREQLPVESLE